MLVDLVQVAAGGVGLPDLDQRVADRPAVARRARGRDDDALAERLAGVLAREIVVAAAERSLAEDRARRASAARAGSDEQRTPGARRRVER